MDLLTAVMHELGHVLGHDDLDAASHPTDLMSESLSVGIRHAPLAESVAMQNSWPRTGNSQPR